MEVQAEAVPITAGDMKPLDPRQIWVLRIRLGITLLFVLAAAFSIDAVVWQEAPRLAGAIPGLVFVLGLAALIFVPARRYRAWRSAERDDELHIRHGLLVRVQTAVPFARVQHIDVAQGPVERRFGLARLILHTAGTRGASIPLPGLAHAEAVRLEPVVLKRVLLGRPDRCELFRQFRLHATRHRFVIDLLAQALESQAARKWATVGLRILGPAPLA